MLKVLDKTDIIVRLKEEIAAILECEPKDIDESANFLNMGISSVQAIKVINKMRNALMVDISPVALFEYKTVSEFAEYLSECEHDEDGW